MTEQTLAARLAKIMGEVGPIAKKGKITSSGSGPTYKFARDSDVMEAVTPKMAEAGIVMIPEHVELLSMGLSLSEKQFIGNIKTSWHVTDGNESLRFETFGQGADTGDKALPKAQSNARKYAFFMLYHIVTGDDPDHYASEAQPERGERTTGREAQPPSRSVAPAPVRTPEEQALMGQLLEMPGMTLARMRLLGEAVGVRKGDKATADQFRQMLEMAQPEDGDPSADSGVGAAPVARGGDGSSDLPAATQQPSGEAATGQSPADSSPLSSEAAAPVRPDAAASGMTNEEFHAALAEARKRDDEQMAAILEVTGGEEVSEKVPA